MGKRWINQEWQMLIEQPESVHCRHSRSVSSMNSISQRSMPSLYWMTSKQVMESSLQGKAIKYTVG